MTPRALAVLCLSLATPLAGCLFGGPNDATGEAAGAATLEDTSLTDGYPARSCGELATVWIAGQQFLAGTVTVTNDAETIEVSITAVNDWVIDEVHIYLGTDPIPVNPAGIPAPGSFPYGDDALGGVDSYAESVSLAELGLSCGDSLNVAVHGAVSNPTEEASETAWAFGEELFPNTSRWGWWFVYDVCCGVDDPGCTYTQGYWKNHPDAWPPVEDDTLCGFEWMEILHTPVRGNAWINLAHQWIAASLNVANGADDSEVADALTSGEELLLSYCSDGAEDGLPTIPAGADRDLAIDAKDTLDEYNNGLSTVPHCDSASGDDPDEGDGVDGSDDDGSDDDDESDDPGSDDDGRHDDGHGHGHDD